MSSTHSFVPISWKPWRILTGTAVLILGAVVLFGWLFSLPALQNVLAGPANMKANTALSFILIGAALLSFAGAPGSPQGRRVIRGCALAVFLIGLLTLLEYAGRWNFGIDELLAHDTGALRAGALPGRMSEASALCLALIGIALWFGGAPRRAMMVQTLALVVAVLSGFALAGYLYGVNELARFFVLNPVAFHTALGLALASIGLLYLEPERGWMADVSASGTGGLTARRLLPAAILVPVLIGWLRLKGQDLGWYGTEVGLALLTSANVLTFAILIWANARVLNTVDADRRRGTAQIAALNRTLLVLSGINQAIVRIRHLPTLYERVCEIAVGIGGFHVIRIYLIDETQAVTLAAYQGGSDRYIGDLRQRVNSSTEIRSMIADLNQGADHLAFNQIATNPDVSAEWRAMGEQMGCESMALLPLRVGGTLRGAMTLGAREPDFFTTEELRLLDEMASDLAFAMEFVDQENARRETQAALLESESRYHRVLDTMLEGVQILGFDWRYLYVNDTVAQQGQLPREVLLQSRMTELYPGIEQTAMFSALNLSMKARTAQHFENEFVYPNGERAWFDLSVQPVPEGIFVLSLDITERKQAEISLRRSSQRMKLLHEIDTGIISAQSIPDLVTAALRSIREIIPCEQSGVILFDATASEATFFAIDSDVPSRSTTGSRFPLTADLMEDFNGRAVAVIDDLSLLPENSPTFQTVRQEGMRSNLRALLTFEGQPIGMLVLNAAAPNYFTAEHQEIAGEIASQLAIAVRQKDLAESLTRHTHTIEEIREFLQTTFDAFPAHAVVLEPDGTSISVNRPWTHFAEENGGHGNYLGTNYLAVCDRSVGPMSAEAAPAAAGIRAVIAGQKDDFYLEYPCSGPTEDRWFMLRVTPFAEAAPRRVVVSHINITERKQAEQAELEQHRNAEALRDSLAVLTASLDVETVMRRILDYSANVIPSEAGTIILFQDHQSHVAYSRGYSTEAEAYFREHALPIDAEMYQRAYGDKGFYLVNDTATAPDWLSIPVSNWVRSSMGVPIVLRGEPIGLLVADSGLPNRFEQKDVENLQAFARYAALALQNARHVHQLEKRVTERTAELEAAKTRVEVILDNSLDAILLLDDALHIRQVNAAFYRLFACEIDDYFGQSLLSLVSTDDTAFVEERMRSSLVDRSGTRLEARARRKDGTAFEAEFSLGYVEHDGVVCTLRDVSERKAQERQLRYQASLQKNVSDAVIVTDTAYRIQSWNQAAERIYGWSSEEVSGRSVAEVLKTEFPTASDSEQAGQQLREIGWWQGEVVQRHKDGSACYIFGSVTLVKDESGIPIGIVSVNRDISERKQAEELLNSRLQNEREFQGYLKTLQEISIELTQIDDLAAFESEAVRLGRERFGFDRLAMFLYDPTDGAAVGTFGTDRNGNQTDERHIRFIPNPDALLARAFSRAERFYFEDTVTVYDDMQPIGTGWNAAAVLWNGTRGLGWLAADNLIHHKPASQPQLEILSLYALAVAAILAQKQIQLDLRASEARYRMLADNINDLITRVDQDGKLIYVSPSSRTLLGYEPEELIGQSGYSLIHPDDVELLLAPLSAVDEHNTAITPSTYRIRHRNGHYLWMETSGQVIRSPETGELLGFITVSRDLTERKRTADALALSEQRYSLLVNGISDYAIYVLDATGHVASWNPGAQNIKGYTADEILGKDFTRFYTEEDIARGQPQKVLRIAEQEGHYLGEGWRVRKDGSRFWAEVAVTPLHDPDGKLIGFTKIVHDLTQRKQIETALVEQRDFLQLVIDNVPGLIMVKDRSGRFILVNNLIAHIYGMTPQMLIGKTDEDVHFNHEEVAFFTEKDRELMATGQPIFIPEETILGRYYQTSKIPLRQNDGSFDRLLVVASDITERRQAEETLRRAFQQEKELGELKSRFVSMASHEFRTPLATILSSAETLSAYRQRMTDTQIDQRLNNIHDQVDHLKDIIEDVLQLSRIQSGRLTFNPVMIDLDSLCRSVLDEFESRSDIAHKFIYHRDERVHALRLDKQLMRQVINNLASNAVKYSPEGKEIFVSLEYADGTVVLTVRDQGIGIPEADVKHLFEPFHRASNVGTISGTGLGLAITKEAVQLHGGTIHVETQVEMGSSFIVTIPLPKQTGDNDDENSGH